LSALRSLRDCGFSVILSVTSRQELTNTDEVVILFARVNFTIGNFSIPDE